jgi:hypothetical protein
MENIVRKRGITVRFSDPEITNLVREKNRRALDNVSDFIRLAVLEKIQSESMPNIAGNNLIEYDPSKDSFVWKIKIDDGHEKIVLDNITIEFIQDLNKQISFQLIKRDELLHKKQKKSVAVPKGLIK